ncbi:radical SAM family heme chaperone HemW [Anaerococcus vaginalis]|uniref:radical SAM family heme chaperone HemW n=1 Tax=Anaerococcus vaginalis TaxID=33037 RepID=UPI00290D4ECA|nr:radical SAM family heme chaperone HemW [Anaerococcus vaginalis]MDU5372621.1 radical SAM family heme chaperone HemW [Anaerococcus vaginalis]
MEKIGIYIHIPFCKKKCFYCDFTAFQNLESWIDLYFENLKKEIKLYRKNMNVEVDSIYIGGGTPTYVDYHYIIELVEILKNFDLSNVKEFTIEANPNSLTLEKLKAYKNLGINRISLGVQSFDDKVLKNIGRDHNKEIVLKDIENIRKAGFDNLSLDMILNLPGGNFDSIKNDLEIIKKINPEHLSYYSLILEKGSHFYSLYKKDKLKLMDDDLERDIFSYIEKYLKNLSLKRYEISNFSKKGFESYHNKKYWSEGGYLAFGLGASGFLSNVRYNNVKNFVKYENLINEGKFPIEFREFISKDEREKEYIIFKLREVEGINLKEFENIFGYSLLEKYSEPVEKFLKLGFFKIDDSLRFTHKGFDLSNEFYIEII